MLSLWKLNPIKRDKLVEFQKIAYESAFRCNIIKVRNYSAFTNNLLKLKLIS